MTEDKIVVVQIYNDIMDATLAKDKLKENGIDSFLENENPIGLNPLGGTELKIFSTDKEQAEKIIAQ
ncbi:MAG: DUF2007 domain-containing protein [Ferruginibacter sp.]|nr:DUF2007 domain-containing protein [Ferruginibacter sp.]